MKNRLQKADHFMTSFYAVHRPLKVLTNNMCRSQYFFNRIHVQSEFDNLHVRCKLPDGQIWIPSHYRERISPCPSKSLSLNMVTLRPFDLG